ncbi:MAG TPA: hypothetical protein VFX70_19565 [Mycobacteriales bacterium]|nr:hypothetical protein [Mycobacteriales bacterium]
MVGPGATPGLANGGAGTALLISPTFPAVTNEMDPNTGQIGVQVGDGSAAVVSPDGAQVAYARDIDPCVPEPEGGCKNLRDLLVADRDGTGEHAVYHDPLEDVQSIRWSPDGSSLVFNVDGGPGDRAVIVVGLDGTVRTTVLSAFGADFSPDGTRLAYSADGNIRVMDLASDVTTAITNDGTASPLPPDWSGDGRHIAYAGNDDGLYVMNADGSGRFNANDQQVGGYTAPRGPIFSPHDKQIAFIAQVPVEPFNHVYVMDTSGADLHVIADTAGDLSQWIRR